MKREPRDSNHCELVRQHEPKARVVLNSKSRFHCQNAIRELIRGVAKSTDARLSIDGGDRSLELIRPTPVEIHFDLLDRGAELGKDGFHIRIAADRIEFQAEHEAGFNNGVYTFLERFCGFRWLWPGETGEAFDRHDSLHLPIGGIREIPDFKWRHLLKIDMPDDQNGKWGIMEFHMLPSKACDVQFTEWLKRNRMGGLEVVSGHTWGRFISPDDYGGDHPDFFAEVNGSRQTTIAGFNGKHGGQLCTTNPQVIELMVAKVREIFDQFPETDVVSISPNDGTAFCECDACIALDVKYGNPPPQKTPSDGLSLDTTFKDDADATEATKRITGPITDRMFVFANQVAAEIAQSHPDKKLLLLVYSIYKSPPKKVRLADNVIAQFCAHCHQHWEPTFKQRDNQGIADLSKMTVETGIYEYYDQGIWPSMPRLFPDLIADSVRFCRDHGVRHYSTQAGTGFATNGFNLWFLARALWDADAQVDEVLEDYCANGFGPAAGAMRDYFELWRQRWRECRGVACMSGPIRGSDQPVQNLLPYEQVLELYPPDFMEQIEATIARARAAVDPFSVEQSRLDFFGRMLEGLRIAMEAARFSKLLKEKGWPMRGRDIDGGAVAKLGPPNEVLAEARKGLLLWGRWEAFLETVGNDFLFSFFWTRYNLDGRKSWQPYYALDRVKSVLEDQQHHA